MSYNKIDLKKFEKSVNTAYNVRALIGCLTNSLHDKVGDSLETEEKELFWQLKGALQMAYDVLDDTTTTFFEVLEVIDRQQRNSNQGGNL